jgi:hypothetical protein
MSIIYPSINTSNFATLGSNTFIGTEIVTGSVSVTNLLSASAITASDLFLNNNPYATTGAVSGAFAKLNGGNTFSGGTNVFEGVTAHNTVIVDGTSNFNYAYLFLQGSTESRLKIRKGGATEVGSFYNSADVSPELVIEGVNGIQLTGSVSGLIAKNQTLSGTLVSFNTKVNIATANSGVVDQFTGSYKATRYTIMAETTTGTYHVQTADILLAHNNSNVLITPYAVTCTSGSYLASFDAQYSGSNIQLLATNLVASNIAVTMTKTYLA